MIFINIKVITILLVLYQGFIATHGLSLNSEDLDDDTSGNIRSRSKI